MNVSQQRRLWVVIAILFVFTLVVIYRLVSFQVVQEEELAELGKSMHYENVVARPARGMIYDHRRRYTNLVTAAITRLVYRRL
jgi:cell division protein FtsI/penicillin-binding protein 2